MKVIGHLNPDTDSTCAPIVYVWYLKQKGIEAQACLAGEPNREAKYVLEFLKVAKPEIIESIEEGEKYILVDTNNPEELISGYDKGVLKGVVDHHKLVGGLVTEEPIHVTIRPIACTTSVIYELIQRDGFDDSLPKDIAGLILAGILSDTLNFTSPTTTNVDKEIAEKMAQITDIDIEKFAKNMFEAKSDLSGLTPEDLLVLDSKKFDLGDKKFRVSVLETTNPSNALSMKDEIRQAMEQMVQNDGFDGVFFFVVDILKSESTLIVSNNAKEIAKVA